METNDVTSPRVLDNPVLREFGAGRWLQSRFPSTYQGSALSQIRATSSRETEGRRMEGRLLRVSVPPWFGFPS